MKKKLHKDLLPIYAIWLIIAIIGFALGYPSFSGAVIGGWIISFIHSLVGGYIIS